MQRSPFRAALRDTGVTVTWLMPGATETGASSADTLDPFDIRS
jgi:hypothetical protein